MRRLPSERWPAIAAALRASAHRRHRPCASTITRRRAKPLPAARLRDGAHDLRVFDLLAAAAGLADQQHAVMRVAEMLAGRVGVEGLDLVDEAVAEKEIERPVHGRRRRLLAFAARKLFEDRIGAERCDAVAEDVEHPPPQRRQLDALTEAGKLDPGRPARRVMFRSRTRSPSSSSSLPASAGPPATQRRSKKTRGSTEKHPNRRVRAIPAVFP